MNYKIGYSFNVRTGEFISAEIVYQEKATGLYPCADNVTFIEPPKVAEHQKQVWNGKDWYVVADYRGSRTFTPDGKESGFINELGISPHDVIIKEPPEVDQYHQLSWKKDDWVVSLKEEYILGEDGNPREMTQAEKIIAGKEELPEGMKLVDGKLVEKTRDDYFNEGKITIEEYNKQVDEKREARFRSETDKMGFMYLRGECTLKEWQLAMDKIKEELPKK